MDEQQTQTGAPQERVYERCLCREAMDFWMGVLGGGSEARKHLRNSRIEFLRAIRSVIDHRIEHLSSTGTRQGTRVTVE